MNPYRRAALFLIRLIAGGFLCIGVFYLFPDAVLLRAHRKVGALPVTGHCLIFIAGMILLLKSDSLARKLTEDFDE